MNTYSVRLMMAEVRNDAGRKVAVQPIYVKAMAETPQKAVEQITAAFGAALLLGLERLQQSASPAAAPEDGP